jgi:hypothetical protein
LAARLAARGWLARVKRASIEFQQVQNSTQGNDMQHGRRKYALGGWLGLAIVLAIAGAAYGQASMGNSYRVEVVSEPALIVDERGQSIADAKLGDRFPVLLEPKSVDDRYFVRTPTGVDGYISAKLVKRVVEYVPPPSADLPPLRTQENDSWWGRNWGWVAGGAALAVGGGALALAGGGGSDVGGESTAVSSPSSSPGGSPSSSPGSSSSYDGTYKGAGQWTYTRPDGSSSPVSGSMTVVVSGSSVTVHDRYGDPPARGSLGGNSFTASKSFTYYSKRATKVYKGTISGTRISGTISGTSEEPGGTGYDSGSFSVSK